MTATCSTCKHWEANSGAVGYVPTNDAKLSACLHPKLNIEGRVEAWHADYLINDGGRGPLTGPDFGCVHHEDKP